MFVLPTLGTLQIDEIETTHISMVLNKYIKTFSASGANPIGRHLGALLGFAVENKRIKGHDRPKVPRIPVQKMPRPIITIEDLDKFLEAMRIAKTDLKLDYLWVVHLSWA
jgi:hypothetical protein